MARILYLSIRIKPSFPVAGHQTPWFNVTIRVVDFTGSTLYSHTGTHRCGPSSQFFHTPSSALQCVYFTFYFTNLYVLFSSSSSLLDFMALSLIIHRKPCSSFPPYLRVFTPRNHLSRTVQAQQSQYLN